VHSSVVEAKGASLEAISIVNTTYGREADTSATSLFIFIGRCRVPIGWMALWSEINKGLSCLELT